MPRQAGTHRRSGVSVLAELRRVRDELGRVRAERDQWKALYLADTGPSVSLSTACALAADAYHRGLTVGSETARPVVLLDVDQPGPFPSEVDRQQITELDRLRYPPNGRKRFSEPWPGESSAVGS